MPDWQEARVDPEFTTRWQVVHPNVLIRKVDSKRSAGLISAEQVLRDEPGRTTVFMSVAGLPCVVKMHRGVGWMEILKNLVYLRWPVLDAGNEWRGLRHLQALGIPAPRPLAMVRAGRNPATRRSYIVMSRLDNTLSLEDFCSTWPSSPPQPGFRYSLTRELARLCRVMHRSGMNHRDCYLCHFHLLQQTEGDLRLYLIDLHRARISSRVTFRWRVKDLAGLLYSALDIGLTRRDLYRFMCRYSECSLRETLERDRVLWTAVLRRARREHRRLSGKQWPLM